MEGVNAISAAWKTILEMLVDRGEDVSGVCVGDAEIAALAEEFATFSVSVRPGLAVVFNAHGQTAKKSEVFVAEHVIMVQKTKNTSTIKSLNNEAAVRGARLEVFDLRELQYNVSRHELVPRHRLVPASEAQAVLSDFRLQSRFHLPIILHTDVMARYLGLRHADIVQVTRPSPTTGTSVMYRCCM
jgi:DNA-directed RNA polymerase subunit H (RpoH/RPB5)